MSGREQGRTIPGDWHPGVIPPNVTVAAQVIIESSYSFVEFRSSRADGATIGEGSAVYQGTMFDVGTRGKISIGRCSLLNGVRLICDGTIEIGDYALISWNVVLMDSYRVAIEPDERRRLLQNRASLEPVQGPEEPASPIRIGNNVWIGFDACVLPGVTIGDGAVVGARSVVFEDVPALTVVAGNPARKVRQLEAR